MERLTFKDKNYYTIPEELVKHAYFAEIYTKLKHLENIEEELGCPLDVREQAFNNGFYDENGNHYYCEHYVPFLKQMHTTGIMASEEKRFNLKDYKKTWWLKKDKSE